MSDILKNQKQKKVVEAFLNYNRNKFKAAESIGMPRTTFRRFLDKAFNNPVFKDLLKSNTPDLNKDTKVEDINIGPNRQVITSSHKIRTLKELIHYCKIDLNIWDIKKHVINSWGSATNKSFQVKVWLSEKDNKLTIEDIKKEFKDYSTKYSPVYKDIKYDIAKTGNAAEIAIHDLHFGSLCWSKETGANYDIKIAEEMFMDAVYDLYNKIKPFSPEEIIFPIGSDFFNVNSKLNITANNTYQDEDCRWQKTFIYGRRMVVSGVDVLSKLAPVKLVVIPGNHDEERSFYLGDSLESWYRLSKNVTVDNTPTPRKYWDWGDCLIGFTHGSDEVKGTLPIIMATEVPKMWSVSKFREWHTGHLHHKATKSYDYATEQNGIRERILPSLASTDSWHKKKGYSGLRSAEAYIWNKKSGNEARLSHYPLKYDK
ncbi:hypothetical protein [Lutibacter sp.]|uniref:hypothetical protein n=1 Tax=Lutibacter sp. TaxID=1925666 RepID=UPI0025C5BF0A|nr:hypothetical protein [Lutibacter sp.]